MHHSGEEDSLPRQKPPCLETSGTGVGAPIGKPGNRVSYTMETAPLPCENPKRISNCNQPLVTYRRGRLHHVESSKKNTAPLLSHCRPFSTQENTRNKLFTRTCAAITSGFFIQPLLVQCTSYSLRFVDLAQQWSSFSFGFCHCDFQQCACDSHFFVLSITGFCS